MEDQYHAADLEARVRRVIGEAIGVDPETLAPDNPVTQEEGLVGGLHLVQAWMAIREEFQLDIPDEDAGRLFTLRAFTDYIHCRLTGQPLPWAKTHRQLSHTTSAPQPAQTTRPSATKASRKRRQIRVTPKTDSKDPGRPFHAWKFDMGRWEPVEDVVYRGSLEESFDFEESLARLRYHRKPALVMGTREQGMHVEVYDGARKEATPPDYAFYIKLWVGQDVESIYVTNLPSLITLLSRLGTIVGNAQIPGEEL